MLYYGICFRVSNMERESMARRDYLDLRSNGWSHNQAMNKIKIDYYGGSPA